MVTKTQKHVLEVLKRDGVKVAPLSLGKSRSAVGMHETRLYKQFKEYVTIMIDFYPVFDRRLREDEEVYSQLRKLARLIRKEV